MTIDVFNILISLKIFNWNSMTRAHGRAHDQLRPITLQYDVIDYAAASLLFEQGRTKVLCAITLQNSVPPFLKGKKTGWLTAEYAMLPTATHNRKERDSLSKPNGRSIEISRLIGRALRSIVDLKKLDERTIVVDCDVIQADGSTRTACITAAYLALERAVARWQKSGKLVETILRDDLAAVSLGVSNNNILLDLDFAEDSVIDADFNFIMTRSGNIVEIQGSAEKYPVSWDMVEKMNVLARKGISEIFQITMHQSPYPKQQPFNNIRIRSDDAQ
jgi:ribonuclease PH